MAEMSYRHFDSLNYNHRLYNGMTQLIELYDLLSHSHNEWERDISAFLKDWLNELPTIELQTSGSTGQPKVISVSKSSMIHSAHKTLEFFSLKECDKALLCLSPKYIAGKMMVVRAMVGGLNLICNGVLANPVSDLDESIDFAAMVPVQAQTILEESKQKFDLIKKIILGGATVDHRLSERLNSLSTEFWETYGMTETVSHIALRRVSAQKSNPFTLLDGITVDVDEFSCLIVKPSNINAQLLKTNDVVELVNTRQFILKGRIDNIINSGGMKLYPEEIERKLVNFIDQPFVISSVPNVKWGESLIMVIESKDDPDFDSSLFNVLKKSERPRFVFSLPVFPRTENGKIKRHEIRKLLLESDRISEA